MALFHTKRRRQPVERTELPAHIAVIMDGNGRWAKKHGLPRTAGHVKGAQTFRTITRYCSDIGIKYLTVYAFSTENWKRPRDEIDALMGLFGEYLDEILRDFGLYNMKLNFIGEISGLPEGLQARINNAMRVTRELTGITVNIAINYGSRQEILRAAREAARRYANGEIRLEGIDESLISSLLYTAGQPDPDLIIRPSGEQRISNFLLWQSAYTEFWYSDILWPDFQPDDLDAALEAYSKRNRRFGGI